MAVQKALLVAGGGALAAYALHRASQPAAPGTGWLGYTAVKAPGGTMESTAEPAARRSLRVPCGAPRVTTADIPMDGSVGGWFEAEWASEVRSLVARYGELTFLGKGTGRPRLTADCCVEWIEAWLAAFERLRDKEPFRWGVLAAHLHLDADPATHELVRLRNLAAWARGDHEYEHAMSVSDALNRFAIALDQHARRDLGDPVEDVVDAAKSVGRGLVGGVSFIVGDVLGGLAGAVVGAVLPYVAIGGALYLVVRSKQA